MLSLSVEVMNIRAEYRSVSMIAFMDTTSNGKGCYHAKTHEVENKSGTVDLLLLSRRMTSWGQKRKEKIHP